MRQWLHLNRGQGALFITPASDFPLPMVLPWQADVKSEGVDLTQCSRNMIENSREQLGRDKEDLMNRLFHTADRGILTMSAKLAASTESSLP